MIFVIISFGVHRRRISWMFWVTISVLMSSPWSSGYECGPAGRGGCVYSIDVETRCPQLSWCIDKLMAVANTSTQHSRCHLLSSLRLCFVWDMETSGRLVIAAWRNSVLYMRSWACRVFYTLSVAAEAGGNCITMGFTKSWYDNQIMNEETGEACSTRTNFGRKTWRKETTYKTTLHLKVIVIFGIRLMSKMEIVFNEASCGSVMFPNRMLRTMFGPKRQEVTGK
jgi:hypothetical protein